MNAAAEPRPLIGVTADIEWHATATPPRRYYELDAQVPEALAEAGASTAILSHVPDESADWHVRLDGLVISGGDWRFPGPGLIDVEGGPPHKRHRAAFEIALVRTAIASGVPLLGICGGFQVLNHVAGGLLLTDLAQLDAAWVAHAGADRSRVEHRVRATVGSRLAGIVGTEPFEVNSQHRQGVRTAGRRAIAAAWSEDGLVEAIELPSQAFCIGVQWHPEFGLTPQDERLVRAFVEACVERRRHRPGGGGHPTIAPQPR